MTLHDKLKEIIDRHNYKLCMLPGSPDQETISAIIQAFTERLPGEQEEQGYYDRGWNAYREQVRKVFELPSTTL